MKNPIKKLAKKHFRHLDKTEREDPISVLGDLYEQQTGFRSFRMQVELLLLSGLDGRLRRNGFDYNFTGQRLKRQIEIAYLFYVQADIKKKVSYHPHVQRIRDTYDVILRQDAIYTTEECLFLFFKYLSLPKWRKEIDEIVSDAALALDQYHHDVPQDSIIIYHYVLALVDALYRIYQNGGLELELPKYLWQKGEQIL